jgi:hypothetical protein
MGYEVDPETNGMLDNAADVLGGPSAREKLNWTRVVEGRRLAQMGQLGHKDERDKDEEAEAAFEAFVKAMEAAANRVKEVDGYELPRVGADRKMLGGAGVIVTAGAAQQLFGHYLRADGEHADNENTLEVDEAA